MLLSSLNVNREEKKAGFGDELKSFKVEDGKLVWSANRVVSIDLQRQLIILSAAGILTWIQTTNGWEKFKKILYNRDITLIYLLQGTSILYRNH